MRNSRGKELRGDRLKERIKKKEERKEVQEMRLEGTKRNERENDVFIISF